MKFIVLSIVFILTCVSSVFAEDSFKSKTTIFAVTGNDTNYENRLAIIPTVDYKNFLFKGDYNFDYKEDNTLTRTQQKSLVGLRFYDGFSARYQYEDYNMDKFVVVRGKEVVKNICTNENRYGLGYEKSFKLGDVTVKNDLMILKEQIQEARLEYTTFVYYKNFIVRNQIYWDFDSRFNEQKYFEKIILTYKLTENVGLTWQTTWVNGPVTHRAGLAILF